MDVVYPVSPCPGPSRENVANPRRRKTFSHSKNSSFVESSPGNSTASAGRSAPIVRRSAVLLHVDHPDELREVARERSVVPRLARCERSSLRFGLARALGVHVA